MDKTADILLLAAGFGTRLKPLTDTIPKPLIEIGGKPLIDWHLEMIAREGFTRVFVNVHHLKDKIISHLKKRAILGLEIIVVEENERILDTGGAIKNIESQLRTNTLLTINSDILLGRYFPLRAFFEAHTKANDGRVITMMLRADSQVAQYGAIGIDDTGRVCKFLGRSYVDSPINRELMFLGVQALNRSVIEAMPRAGSVFSVTRDTLVKVLAGGDIVQSVVYSGYWNDVGTPERLAQAKIDF